MILKVGRCMDIKEKAKLFAINVHYGQVRKSEVDKPMIIHPINVATILNEYSFDDNVIAAGYLHDAIEDTKYNDEDLLKEFGEDILSLVMGDSEPDKKLSWEERKQYTIDKVKTLDIRHKAVVCADKISNLEDLQILFEKMGRYDFSNFNRGYEKQKWYFTSLYENLISNEDENFEMFKRLKKLIDEIFNGVNNFEILDSVFKDNEKEIKMLKKIHYQKIEIKKLSTIFNSEPYTIEFTGTPRTGKTTLINNLKDFFKKGKFNVDVLEEFTTSDNYKKNIYPKLKNQYTNVVNFEIPKYVLKQLNESFKSGNDIIIVDRSLFDRLIWVDRLFLKDGINLKDYEDYKLEYIPLIKNKINIVIATYVDSFTAISRDYNANLSIEKRSFLNEDNVDEYNKSLLNMKELANKEDINFYLIDTTNRNQREVSFEIIEYILDDMRNYYLSNIKENIEKCIKK